jgi:hypothetical protein
MGAKEFWALNAELCADDEDEEDEFFDVNEIRKKKGMVSVKKGV